MRGGLLVIIKEVLNRVYVNDIDQAISFYEQLVGEELKSRFQYSEMHLELARVGNILIICGTEEALKPFKATMATFSVDSVAEFRAFLLDNGGEILRDIKAVPTGFNMTAKHPDGAIVEYVEFRVRAS